MVPILGKLHGNASGRAVGLAEHGNEAGDAGGAEDFQQERHMAWFRALVFHLNKKFIVVPGIALAARIFPLEELGSRHLVAESGSGYDAAIAWVERRRHCLVAAGCDLDRNSLVRLG